MKLLNQKYSIALSILLLSFLFSFCAKDDVSDNSGDPSNLVIEVLSIDLISYNTVLQATAMNTVQYQLFVGSSSSPADMNVTGLFEYTFEGEGIYNIEIKAYGSSGRYIKSQKIITISSDEDPNPVPIDSGFFSAEQYEGYTRVWEDEFFGSSINTASWNFDIGNGCPNICGWGNNELEYYRTENAWVSDGLLTIEARKEYYMNYNYTSAKLHSKNKKSFKYGRVDIRALMPVGKGMWPALWMLGNNISTAGWPQCGEIDIMEMIGGDNLENTIYGTNHWYNGEHASHGSSKALTYGTYATAYHVFSMLWDEYSIKFLVDDQIYHETSITNADMSEFHQEFYFIFNVAVGGNWPGYPNETTIFPQKMRVDYVRVFQKD